MTSAKAKKQVETGIVKEALAKLIAYGCEAFRNNSGGTPTSWKRKDGSIVNRWMKFGLKGSGDIIGCSLYGRYVELEAKILDGTMKPEQLARQQAIQSKGGVYIIARADTSEIDRLKYQLLAKPVWMTPVEYKEYLEFKEYRKRGAEGVIQA